MIDKREILDAATGHRLTPHVVENNKHKDKRGYPCPGRAAYYTETRH